MRYYEDGVLRQGLQIAPNAYPLPLVTGIYHVVWADSTGIPEGETQENDGQFDDGEIISYSADEPNIISILHAGPETKETLKREPELIGNEPYRMTYRFGTHDLSYSSVFSDAVSTNLTRSPNSLTEWGPAAKIHFGVVCDDQGFPFLKFRATYTDPRDNSLNILESVAKKTDSSGLHSRDLTKNEKLRLGFPIPEDKPARTKPVKDESPKGIMATLESYAHATALQIEKVDHLRVEIDEQLRSSRAILQNAVNLSLDVPAEPEREDPQSTGRQPKRKRTRGRYGS